MKLFKASNIYLKNSTLHGFSYISNGKCLAEKIFWICAITVSLICCIMLLKELIEKVDKNPVIIERSDTAIPIREIPFPAISICPGSVQNGSLDMLDLLFELKKNTTFKFIKLECFRTRVVSECSRKELEAKMYELGLPYWFGIGMRWMKRYKPKSDMIISPFGWCKTFNIIENSEMFHANSTADHFRYYEPITRDKTDNILSSGHMKPLRTVRKENGFRGHIEIPSMDWRICLLSPGCTRTGLQHNIVIHPANELPDLRHKRFDFNIDFFLKLTLEAQLKITDKSLLGLDVDERRCYQSDERKLKFHKIYTTINCLKECESSYIFEKCSCVPYYFIRNDMSRICDKDEFNNCFKRAYEQFDESTCKCYPPCENLDYDVTGQSTRWEMSRDFVVTDELMVVTANFKLDGFHPQIKRKYFTMVDWFSFIGSILGLFFGFSFLSVFEIFYHFWKLINDEKLLVHCRQRKFFVKRSQPNKLLEYVKEFLRNSSIHGLSYISNSKVNNFERIAWIFSVLISITTCLQIIRLLRLKLAIGSMSIVISNNLVKLQEIPFPAVTLMSENHYDYILQHDWNNYSYTEKASIRDLTRASHYFNYLEPEFMNFTGYSHKIVPFLQSFRMENYFDCLDLKWDGSKSVKTAHILTSIGFGHSFNIASNEEMLNMERMSNDFFYSYGKYFHGEVLNDTEKHPWMSNSRHREIFEIISDTQQLSLPIFIHSPYELPIQLNKEQMTIFDLSYGSTLEVLITPEIMTMSEELKELSVDHRMCYIEGERKLKFFKVYTPRNCEIECLAAQILVACGCLPFDIVRESDVKVCELIDYICVEKVKSEILLDVKVQCDCNCLQTCNHISYSLELITLKHDIREYLENLSAFPVGTVRFVFKDKEFHAKERIQNFTIYNFLTYIGGLLGLFAGISVLSLFEIFYFVTLRLICEIARTYRLKQNKVEQQKPKSVINMGKS